MDSSNNGVTYYICKQVVVQIVHGKLLLLASRTPDWALLFAGTDAGNF